MHSTTEPAMGSFSVEVDLANNEDVIRSEAGVILPEQIRRVRVRGVVDTGATRLVLPESVAQQLGLKNSSNAKVRYADGRINIRPIAQNIQLSNGGRQGVFSAVIQTGSELTLIGAIVLEDL